MYNCKFLLPHSICTMPYSLLPFTEYLCAYHPVIKILQMSLVGKKHKSFQEKSKRLFFCMYVCGRTKRKRTKERMISLFSLVYFLCRDKKLGLLHNQHVNVYTSKIYINDLILSMVMLIVFSCVQILECRASIIHFLHRWYCRMMIPHVDLQQILFLKSLLYAFRYSVFFQVYTAKFSKEFA